MEISKLLEDEFSSDDEKQKLTVIGNNNMAIIDRLKKTMSLLDKIEASIDQKIKKQLSDIENMKQTMTENLEIFKSICKSNIGH